MYEHKLTFGVITFYALVILLYTYSTFDVQGQSIFKSLMSSLSTLAKPLVPLHLAIYLIHFHKARYDTNNFNKFFAKIKVNTKAVVSMSVMVIFLLIVLDKENNLDGNKLLDLALQSLAALFVVSLFDILKIQRNKVEDMKVLNRSKHHVAPGLAMAFFRFIENVVHGVKDDKGGVISKPHKKALEDWIRSDEDMTNMRNWISDKILVFFPKSERMRGSVHDIASREKADGEDHCLTLEKISHKYMTAGQPRRSVLNVVKIKDYSKAQLVKCSGFNCPEPIDEDRISTFRPKNCEQIHERKSWQNNYVIFAENRPLNTLHQMRDAPDSQISFDQNDFAIQFELFYRELERLLGEDSTCKERVELFKYNDYAPSKVRNFTFYLQEKLRRMKVGDSSTGKIVDKVQPKKVR